MWNRTCGYYLRNKGSATHIFFQSLTKGDHIIENLKNKFVTPSGVFNTGILPDTISYAPENRGHSSGEIDYNKIKTPLFLAAPIAKLKNYEAKNHLLKKADYF
jgi:hypothetical protein